MLLKYKNYINESLTPEEIENLKKKAMSSHMRMYLSKDLSLILKDIDHPIAQDLLTISRRNIKFNISFMDIPKGNSKTDIGKVTVIPTKRVKTLEDKGLDIGKARNNYNSEIWTSNTREIISIGKVIKRMYKDAYSLVDIEKFSNLFKAKMDSETDRLRIVYGEDIKKYYLEKYYAEKTHTLGGSCMRQENRNKFMQIYADNTPDGSSYSHIGMLVLFNNENKVLGRSIIWFNSIKPYYKEDNNGKIINIPRIFMDRIYAIGDHYLEIFIDYAKKNNWLYKEQQSYNNNNFIDPIDGSVHRLTLSFRLKPKEYKYYPYMDSLYYYTPETGRIASKKPRSKFKTYECRSTGGIHEII